MTAPDGWNHSLFGLFAVSVEGFAPYADGYRRDQSMTPLGLYDSTRPS